MKIAVCAGSFDPITIGHVDIVERAIPLFDKIILAIGVNSNKKYLFSLEKRLDFLRKTFEHQPTVHIATYKGLTVTFCQEQKAKYLLRGIRTGIDFEFEKTIAQLNQSLANIETVCLMSSPQYGHISSTIVREILINKGDADQFLPAPIRALL